MQEINDKVLRVLEHNDVDFIMRKHRSLGAIIASPWDVANALQYEIQRITKTVLCVSRSGAFVAVVAPMNLRIDFAQAGRCAGMGRLEVASAEQLHDVTGYPRNGVSPLGLPEHVLVVVESSLQTAVTVLVGAGVEGVEIELSPNDVVTHSRAVVASVMKPSD